MSKTRELSVSERSQIVILHKQGLSQVEISKIMKCSRKAVQNAINRFSETGSYENRPKTGRKRILSPRNHRFLNRISLRNRTKSSKGLASDLWEHRKIQISAPSVRRYLKEGNLHGRRARRKPLLTEHHKKLRLEWAKQHQNWSSEDWAKIIWSDESNIEIFGQPGGTFVRRRPGEAFEPECIIPTVKFGGGGIMIWGCMASSGVGEIFLCEGRMNAERYITMLNEVLEPSILKLFDEDVPQYYFQQDNAPCHKAKKSLDWFSTNEVPLITWPPQFPDLSPIENLWSILKRKLSIYRCKSKEEFKAKILDEWEKIPANVCKDLVDSMPKRVRAVIKAKGGAIKY